MITLAWTALILLWYVDAAEWNPQPREIPDFVIRHAPIVYLYSEERYYPGSIEEYLTHMVLSAADRNYTSPLSPANLTQCGANIRTLVNDSTAELFLSSKEQWEPEPGPEWLTKYKSNRPNLWTGEIKDAVATLIVVDKPEIDAIDAFWFYFYPFNLGPFVMGHGPFGNHIGDWEHSLVRFSRMTHEPELVWMSAHGGGTAYTYDSLLEVNAHGGCDGSNCPRNGKRPAIFSARGTHAQYTSSGRHSHDIPWHMLSDFTDRGDLWDPAMNYVAYTFDGSDVHPANGSRPGREQAFGDWLLFDGHWGNKQLDKLDARQQWSPFEWRLIDGPTGPLSKNLLRHSPCERFKWWNYAHSCRIRKRITAGEGIEADATPCDAIIERFPQFTQPLVKLIVSGGYLCFWIDRLFS